MEIVTPEIREQLLENGRTNKPLRGTDDERDFAPVVKLFTPDGNGTWLLTELDPDDPDLAFGLADLGMGAPEPGNVRISELQDMRGALGLPVERDVNFTPTKTLNEYVEASHASGSIAA